MGLRRIAATLGLALCASLAGCGGAAHGGGKGSFAWLRPAPAPADWSVAHLGKTGALAYPPGWQRIGSDPGTVSAARVERDSGLITEYLNASPQQGEETLQNWARFRPGHNREEGDAHDQVLASAQNIRLRNGRGSCVIDRYRTVRTSYQEIACLVRAPAEATVIVATAQTARWAQSATALERAVSAFMA